MLNHSMIALMARMMAPHGAPNFCPVGPQQRSSATLSVNDLAFWPDIDADFHEHGQNLLTDGGAENLRSHGGLISDSSRIRFPNSSPIASLVLGNIVTRHGCLRYTDLDGQPWWVRVGRLQGVRDRKYDAIAIGGANATALLQPTRATTDTTAARLESNVPSNITHIAAARLFDRVAAELTRHPLERVALPIQTVEAGLVNRGLAEGAVLQDAIDTLKGLQVRKLKLPLRKWAPQELTSRPAIRSSKCTELDVQFRFDPLFVQFITSSPI